MADGATPGHGPVGAPALGAVEGEAKGHPGRFANVTWGRGRQHRGHLRASSVDPQGCSTRLGGARRFRCRSCPSRRLLGAQRQWSPLLLPGEARYRLPSAIPLFQRPQQRHDDPQAADGASNHAARPISLMGRPLRGGGSHERPVATGRGDAGTYHRYRRASLTLVAILAGAAAAAWALSAPGLSARHRGVAVPWQHAEQLSPTAAQFTWTFDTCERPDGPAVRYEPGGVVVTFYVDLVRRATICHGGIAFESRVVTFDLPLKRSQIRDGACLSSPCDPAANQVSQAPSRSFGVRLAASVVKLATVWELPVVLLAVGAVLLMGCRVRRSTRRPPSEFRLRR